MIYRQNNSLCLRDAHELLIIIPWGNGLRVRSTQFPKLIDDDRALEPQNECDNLSIEIADDKHSGSIVNGKIKAVVDGRRKLTFYDQNGKVLLEEFQRNRNVDMSTAVSKDKVSHFNSALNLDSREFKGIPGGDFRLTVRFESDPDEKLFGMGQYQQPYLNLKYNKLELAQRNSQASVPFLISNLGYGFLWNNPAVGSVEFAKNVTEWNALSTKEMDYWITAGDTPSEIEENYANVTGKVPMMPDFAMGYWQCKLRYRTQEEVLKAAREFKQRNIPINVIVIDYFHWTKSGDWKFDPIYWPDPKAMIEELHSLGIKLMVSIWPTVQEDSENYQELHEKGYLVGVERGVDLTMGGDFTFVDFTNPDAGKYVWRKVKENYADLGVDLFWLDEAEPEYFPIYDFDNYRYYEGSNLQIGNKYPRGYSKAFFDGQKSQNNNQVINLVRSAWAGSQKYGALVWSGDIDSSFQSLRNQLQIGLNMGLAGIPWWTTDIGGFHGGVNDSPAFKELLVRWLQAATFFPVMRMHGDRDPHTEPLSDTGGGSMPSGAPTEPWVYDDKTSAILISFIRLREQLHDYISEQMKAAHEKGTPVMRPLFYDFAHDAEAWNITDEYMFGPDVLVAPIMEAGITKRDIYLPSGEDWIDVRTKQQYAGGQTIEVETPIETIPVFTRVGHVVQALLDF